MFYGKLFYKRAFEERFSFRFKGHGDNWLSTLTDGDFYIGIINFFSF